MLDWTVNPLVAAYFASAPSEAENFALWIFETQWNWAKVDVVVPPYAGNPNLAAQAGVLTHVSSKVPTEDCDIDRRSLEDVLGKEPPLHKFVLSRDMATPLRATLSNFGINGASLFPGFGGVVRYIEEELLGKGR